MGYSTCGMHGAGKARCCDGCDDCPICKSRRVGRLIRFRWVRCPVNYCADLYFCPQCYTERATAQRAYCDEHCRPASARFKAEHEARAAARAAGKCVIQAGVNEGAGLVHAWTSTGEWLVSATDYHAALLRPDHVLDDTMVKTPYPVTAAID